MSKFPYLYIKVITNIANNVCNDFNGSIEGLNT